MSGQMQDGAKLFAKAEEHNYMGKKNTCLEYHWQVHVEWCKDTIICKHIQSSLYNTDIFWGHVWNASLKAILKDCSIHPVYIGKVK